MDLKDELAHAGLRSTLTRMRVLEVFRTFPERGFTTDDIYRELLQAGDPIPMPSIYRTVPKLETAGFLRRVESPGHRGMFELARGSASCRILCTDCGHVEKLADGDMNEALRTEAQGKGFRIHRSSLVLHASCTRSICERLAAHRKLQATPDAGATRI